MSEKSGLLEIVVPAASSNPVPLDLDGSLEVFIYTMIPIRVYADFTGSGPYFIIPPTADRPFRTLSSDGYLYIKSDGVPTDTVRVWVVRE